MVEISDNNYEERKKKLYRYQSSDPMVDEAKDLLKYQSRRIGSLQGWNNRYRQRIELLKQSAQEAETLQMQLQRTKDALIVTLQGKASLESDYDVALKELEKIDTRLGYLKSSYQNLTQLEGAGDLKDRWMLLLQAIKDLLFPPNDEPSFTPVRSILPQSSDDPANNWTRESIADTQRDLHQNK